MSVESKGRSSVDKFTISVSGRPSFSYELDFRNVYQKSCDATGSVSTKVKGVLSTENFSDQQIGTKWPQLYRRIWDVSDTVLPPYLGNEFFVLTNLIITPNQTLGVCPEVRSFLTLTFLTNIGIGVL